MIFDRVVIHSYNFFILTYICRVSRGFILLNRYWWIMCRNYYEKCFDISGADIEKSIHWTNKLFALVPKRMKRVIVETWKTETSKTYQLRIKMLRFTLMQLQLFYKHQNNCEIEKRVKWALRHVWAQTLEVGEQHVATETQTIIDYSSQEGLKLIWIIHECWIRCSKELELLKGTYRPIRVFY